MLEAALLAWLNQHSGHVPGLQNAVFIGTLHQDSTSSRGVLSPSLCPWIPVMRLLVLLSTYTPVQVDRLIGFCTLLALKT